MGGAEKGAVIGLFLGLIVLLVSWFFGYFWDLGFCFSFEPEICVRYASLMPLILAFLGLLIGVAIRKKGIVE